MKRIWQNSHVLRFLLVLISVTFSLSCTRKMDDTATFRIDLRSISEGTVGAQSNDLVHIAINIHEKVGDQWNLIRYEDWDSCDDGACSTTNSAPPPKSLVMTIESGKPILIQYMGVEQDSSGEGMIFNYGDRALVTQPGDNFVNITPEVIGATSSGGLNVYGRLITTGGTAAGPGIGPTGTVIGKIVPPKAKYPGRPSMAVTKDELFGGWGRLFLLSGVEFDIVWEETGEVVIAGASPEHPFFQPSKHLMKITPPQENYVAETMGGSSVTSWRLQDEREGFAVGFYSPNNLIATHSACFTNTSGVTIPYAYQDPSTNFPVNWYADGSDGSAHVNRIGGGVDDSGGDCTNNALSLNKILKIPYEKLGDHIEGALPMEGPFLKTADTHGYYEDLQATITGNTIQLQWQYLPGSTLGPNAIEGVAIFQLNTDGLNESDVMDYDFGYYCNNLEDKGYLFEGFFTKDTTTASFTNNGINPSRNDYYAAPKIILCPYRGSQMFGTAAIKRRIPGAGGICELVDEFGGSNNYNAVGSGSSSDPYIICNPGQLQDLSSNGCDNNNTNTTACSNHFELHANIDMSGQGMGPIGGDLYPFEGSFNGNNMLVSNISMSPSSPYVGGLFGFVSLAPGNSIEDLQLDNIQITNNYTSAYTGGLIGKMTAGQVQDVTMTNVFVSGTGSFPVTGGFIGSSSNFGAFQAFSNISVDALVLSNDKAGGFAGSMAEAHLDYIYTYGAVSAGGTGEAGGIVGEAVINAPITWSWLESHADVHSNSEGAGGIVGIKSSGGVITIAESSASGDISIPNGFNAGGIVGNASNMYLEKVQYVGNIYALSIVGGLAGQFFDGAIIDSSVKGNVSLRNSLSAGNTTTDSARIGGLVGFMMNSSITNSYAWSDIYCSTGGSCSSAGGLIGRSYNNVTIEYCYASSGSFPSTTGGGIIGVLDLNAQTPVFTSNFWDNTPTSRAHSATGGSIADMTGQSTSNMQTEAVFSGAGWDFTNIWRMETPGSGLPVHQFE